MKVVKLGRGKECGNVSTMTGHIANLVRNWRYT
jgi:hypothetical protein